MNKSLASPKPGAARFIGDVAKETGLTVKAIRHYEALGLLAPPTRSESGYRLYDDPDVERLRFIQGAKALGLSLTAIQEVVAIWKQGEKPCGHVETFLTAQVADLDRRIAELTSFRTALSALLADVANAPLTDAPCRHIDRAESGGFTAIPPAMPIGRG